MVFSILRQPQATSDNLRQPQPRHSLTHTLSLPHSTSPQSTFDPAPPAPAPLEVDGSENRLEYRTRQHLLTLVASGAARRLTEVFSQLDENMEMRTAVSEQLRPSSAEGALVSVDDRPHVETLLEDATEGFRWRLWDMNSFVMWMQANAASLLRQDNREMERAQAEMARLQRQRAKVLQHGEEFMEAHSRDVEQQRMKQEYGELALLQTELDRADSGVGWRFCFFFC